MITSHFISRNTFAYLRVVPECLDKIDFFKSAILMLHGVPGDVSKRNEDIAYALASKLCVPVYVLHYRGLGENIGKFSFESSLTEARLAFEEIKSVAQSWILIGHSWGGLVATHIAKESRDLLSKLVLMSPVCELPVGEELTKTVESLKLELPAILGTHDTSNIVHELERIGLENSPLCNLKSANLSKDKIYIIQALQDDVTPPILARNLMNSLGGQVNYFELDDDHSFQKNRVEFISFIKKLLSEN